MTDLSKLTFSKRKKYLLTIRLITFLFLMLLTNYFFIEMSIRTFVRGTKKLKDLTHVTGIIKNERYIKYFHPGTKFHQPYYEDVLVFNIQGCNEEFGFLKSDKNYNDLTKVRFFGDNTIADIYYDKSGLRIEENVTLHTFDLKIDDVRYVKIEDVQKSEKIWFIFWSLISLILFVINIIGIRSLIMKNLKTKGYT